MQAFLRCCNMLDPHTAYWLCSPSSAAGVDPGVLDEDLNAEDRLQSPAGIHAFQCTEKPKQLVTSAARRPPRPTHPGVPSEDDKESSKVRLQRLIRDFAHDAVGPGIEVEAHSLALDGLADVADSCTLTVLLRMDRRLSRLELWPLSPRDACATMALPLQQVASVAKGDDREGQAPDPSRDGTSLTLHQLSGPDLRLDFSTFEQRDRAWTCLRIFHMSVDPNSGRDSVMEREEDPPSTPPKSPRGARAATNTTADIDSARTSAGSHQEAGSLDSSRLELHAESSRGPSEPLVDSRNNDTATLDPASTPRQLATAQAVELGDTGPEDQGAEGARAPTRVKDESEGTSPVADTAAGESVAGVSQR